MTGEASRPAWQRPAFEAGNEVGLRHGAHSLRRLSARTAELAAGLLSDRPDLERFPEAVAAWSRAEARCLLVEEFIEARGLISPKGEPTTGVLKYVAAWERLAAEARGRLGLDPMAEAALAAQRAQAVEATHDLEALAASGRAALNARRPEIAPPAPDDGELA